MNRVLYATVVALTIGTSSAVTAGPFADDLGKCLVRSTTTADKTALVRWIFSMVSLHPSIRDLAVVSDVARADASDGVAVLFKDLLAKRCNSEARLAFKNEGSGVIEASFNVLGQVAGRELFADPSVANGMAEFSKVIDGPAIAAALQ